MANPEIKSSLIMPGDVTSTCWSCGTMRAEHFCSACGKVQPPVPVDVVKQGANVTNHIRLEVRGGVISISINGQKLPDLTNPNPIHGMVGMIVVGGKSGMVNARFDNFNLQEQQ